MDGSVPLLTPSPPSSPRPLSRTFQTDGQLWPKINGTRSQEVWQESDRFGLVTNCFRSWVYHRLVQKVRKWPSAHPLPVMAVWPFRARVQQLLRVQSEPAVRGAWQGRYWPEIIDTPGGPTIPPPDKITLIISPGYCQDPFGHGKLHECTDEYQSPIRKENIKAWYIKPHWFQDVRQLT